MINEQEFQEKNIQDKKWLGRVIQREDENLKEGRIKVRIFGLYDELDDNVIPWCYPGNISTSSSESGGAFYSVPKLDSIVEVEFLSDDPYSPVYIRQLHLSEEVKAEIDGDADAQVLWYDVENKMKVFYSKKKGIIFNLDETFFNITADNEIVIKNNGNVNSIKLNNEGRTILKADHVEVVANDECEITTPTLNLRGSDTNIGAAPEFSGVLAEPLWAFLKVLASACDQKWPSSPGVLSSAAEQAEIASTSRTVKTSM